MIFIQVEDGLKLARLSIVSDPDSRGYFYFYPISYLMI